MSEPTSFIAPSPAAGVEPLAKPPTFSIVIATYQAADTVGEAVASALAQTHPALEVIVVDDGSTDRPEEALRPYMDRIDLLRKPNGGGASAMNAGAERAKGDFIAVLDADDSYHPRRLEALAELGTVRPDLDLITTDAAFVVKGEKVGTFATYTPFETEDQRTAIFESCFVGGWPAIRRQRLLEIGGFDEDLRTGYDWDCWTRLLLSGSTAGLATEPYYEYHLHSGSLTGNRVSSLWDRVRLLRKALANPSLREEEHRQLRQAIRRHRSRAITAQAQAVAHAEGPRKDLPALAFAREVEPRARVAALLAAAAPPLARRMLPEDTPAEDRFLGAAR